MKNIFICLFFLLLNIFTSLCVKLNAKSFYSEYINPEVIDEIRKVFYFIFSIYTIQYNNNNDKNIRKQQML